MASDPKFVKAVPTTNKRLKREPGEFLWVDYQDDKSKGREAVRSKQSFVRTRHHRLRREKTLQESTLIAAPLTKCQPPASNPSASVESKYGFSDLSNSHDEDDYPFEQSVIMPSLEVGVLDGAPDPVLRLKHNPNVYFQHCQSQPDMIP